MEVNDMNDIMTMNDMVRAVHEMIMGAMEWYDPESGYDIIRAAEAIRDEDGDRPDGWYALDIPEILDDLMYGSRRAELTGCACLMHSALDHLDQSLERLRPSHPRHRMAITYIAWGCECDPAGYLDEDSAEGLTAYLDQMLDGNRPLTPHAAWGIAGDIVITAVLEGEYAPEGFTLTDEHHDRIIAACREVRDEIHERVSRMAEIGREAEGLEWADLTFRILGI
jgi:hypothetical protein